MDISLNTIGYLMSNNVYKKIQETSNIQENNKEFIKDLKFYKKRVYQKTKNLIKNQIEKKEVNKDLDHLLKTYLVKLIEYFKFEDTKDILQNELVGVNKQVKFTIIKETNDFNADELIMKQPEIKPPTIEDYMNVNVTNKKKENIIMPRSKNINIKQPEFKTKGLKNYKK